MNREGLFAKVAIRYPQHPVEQIDWIVDRVLEALVTEGQKNPNRPS